MGELSDIAKGVYGLAADTWVQYHMALIGCVVVVGGIVLGHITIENFTKIRDTCKACFGGAMLYILHRGNTMSQKRRDKFLDDVAMEAITDRFEEMCQKGIITFADKTRAYRRLGIKMQLFDLVPSRTAETVKAGILLRLSRKVHAPVELPDLKKENPVLVRLLRSKKSVA